MWINLLRCDLGTGLEKMAGAPPKVWPTILGHQNAVILTEPSLISLVLSSSDVMRSQKASVAADWRWLLGDGTSLSDYAEQPEAWQQGRLKKRRAVRSQNTPGESGLAECWNRLDLHRLNGETDAYALLYEALFRANWELFLGQSYTLEAKSSHELLRKTGVIASQTAFDSVAYYDRSFSSLPKSLNFSSRSLLERRNVINVCIDKLLSPCNEVLLVSELRQWSEEQGGSPLQTQLRLRFALTGIFFASFENTATVATWMAWQLAGHPEWQERIAAQDETALEWCLNETLRLHPPVWSIIRQLKEAGRVGEHVFDVGTLVWMSPWVQSRQKTFWERADEFVPQRWKNLEVPRGQFFPFGSGLHSCPGEQSARTQMKSLMRFLLSFRRIERVENAPPPRPFFGVTQRPEKEVRLCFKPSR